MPMSLSLNNKTWCFSKSKAELKLSEITLDSARLSSDACKSCVSNNTTIIIPRPFLKPNWVWGKIFSAFANLYIFLATNFSKNFDIIDVIEISQNSSGNWIRILTFGFGVTVAILNDSGKLPEVNRSQNIS